MTDKKKFFVTLTGLEADYLRILAKDEGRTIHEQGSHIIKQAILETVLGYIPRSKEQEKAQEEETRSLPNE